jgi:hypothetical protein
MHDAPLTHLVTLGLDLAAIVYSVAIARRAGVSMRLALGAGLVMGGWLAVLSWAISTKSVLPANISGPAFFAVVLAFVGVVGVVLFLTPSRVILSQLSQVDLQALQGIRVFFGASFLMQAALGTMPRTFGIVDGFTHVGAGFLGLYAAHALARDPRATWAAWVSNIFGTVDILVVASSLSLVILPEMTPHHSMMYAVFLPAPLWLWLHVVSIVRLVRVQTLAEAGRVNAHAS